MAVSTRSIDTHSPPALDEAEWNFSELPDEEVRACLIWECGRESFDLCAAGWAEELESKTQPSCWNAELGRRTKNSAHDRRRAEEELNDLAFDLDAHRSRLFQCHQAFNNFYRDVIQYARPWSKPWKKLPPEARQGAVKRLADPGIFPPFRTALLHELEGLWTTNGEEIIKIRSGITKPKYDDTLEMLGYEPSQPVEQQRGEGDPDVKEITGAFAINYSLYSDREIIAAFSSWLKAARPCPEPVRVGKKTNDDRAALDGIGVMRAFNLHPFSHSLFPAKLKSRGRRVCDKSRELALRRFHEVLPFLPAEAFPINWEKAKRASKSC